MFETLEEQIASTEPPPSTKARVLRYAGLLVISAIIFAALYAVIRLVD